MNTEEKISWGSIGRIEEIKDYIFIYTSSISAYIISIRTFKGYDTKEEFKRKLAKNINSLTGGR